MAPIRQELSSGWTFKQRDEPESAWLPVAKVPSQVHIDLLANERQDNTPIPDSRLRWRDIKPIDRIPDPFINANELAVKWVEEKDWLYQTRFSAPCRTEGDTTVLVLEGLDTFATVSLNGTQLLASDNMHLSHRVDVTELLHYDAENVLTIVFESALRRGRELVDQHREQHRFLARQTEESRLPVRKAQYGWGWDWGPILLTAGPWRPVYLEHYTARIDDVWTQSEVGPDLKTCSGRIMATTTGARPGADKVVLSLATSSGKTVFEEECPVGAGGVVEAQFTLHDPDLWHPAGYGAQDRYSLVARLLRADQGQLDIRSKLVGFRRTELVQEKDAFGRSFYFRINGTDVFAGGSCWIPADSFLPRVSPQRYRDWMQLLVEGNQTMIRVWGGGIYEDEAFLDACDELGILVWHDFAFVCGNYPAHPQFLASVELEARQSVRRLRSHASVVIWAGNNEDYQVQERYQLEYDADDKNPEAWLRSNFPARYIYEYLLPKWLEEEDPGALYHPGSPWGDGKHTTDSTVGDIHQWNIWHGGMSKYQDSHLLGGRFVSEFGMEAYPHLETTRRMITHAGEQRPGSLLMDFRNKAGDHERRLMAYVAENFQVRYDLAGFTHLTQVAQAETMRFAYKAWRRDWGRPGQRRCGGVLVWQLNDCWPTVSWAIVDYNLVKKPAFYAIARALRPLDIGVSRACHDWTAGHADPTLITAQDTSFDVWIACSHLEPTRADVTVRFISIRSGLDLAPPLCRSNVAVAPNATTEVLGGQPSRTATGSDYDPFVILATLSVNGRIVSTDAAWPQPLKYLDFPDRGLAFEVALPDRVTVSAERPVKGLVFEEKEGVMLSQNGVDLMPGEKLTVQVTGGSARADELRWTYVGAPGASLAIPPPKNKRTEAKL